MNMPVSPGDEIVIPPLKPETTGNTPKRVTVVECLYRVGVRYKDDGRTTCLVMTEKQLLEARQAAEGA